jgi:hypothetical protein
VTDFSGQWQTTFGPMTLEQRGRRVRGVYLCLNAECPVEGEVAGDRLTFTYQEPTVRGEGWFEVTRHGRAFAGQYRPEGTENWDLWEGERVGFDGLWNSSFGLLRLIEEDDGKVRGFYEAAGRSQVRGKVRGNRLTFTYREANVSGRGRFELAEDGLSFQGEWKPRDAEQWSPWAGVRLRPQSDRVWLVVFEAPWQRFLAEQEYSFGVMLREFFARLPHVEVRHRFFTNEAGLRRCCRDLLYLAEPAVVVVASHALPEGIKVDGQTIGLEALEEALQLSGSVRLLHFSACLLLQDPASIERLRTFSRESGVAVSGYATSVNWAASAVIEFMFLELVLAHGLSPAEAAGQLTKLLPFAGDEPVPGAPALNPAGFRIVTPDEGGPTAKGDGRRRRRK